MSIFVHDAHETKISCENTAFLIIIAVDGDHGTRNKSDTRDRMEKLFKKTLTLVNNVYLLPITI